MSLVKGGEIVKMKKILTLVAVLTLALAVVPGVSAHHEPENWAVAVDANLVGIFNENYGDVCNFAFTNANSGFNYVTGKKVTSDTGNALAGAEVTTDENANKTAVTLGDGGEGPVAVNEVENENGRVHKEDKKEGGDNTAIAVDLNAVLVTNFNFGFVNNSVVTGANTGFNKVNGKKAVDAGTGNAEAGAEVATTLNTNKTEVTVDDSESGPMALNSQTTKKHDCCEDDCDEECCDEEPECGCADFTSGQNGKKHHDNDNLAVAVDVNAVLVDNLNVGFVSNFVMTGANTGVNFVDGKKAVTTDTGDALAGTKVDNSVNSNETTVTITDDGAGPAAINSAELEKSHRRSQSHEKGDAVAIAADVNLGAVLNTNFGLVANVVYTGANSGGNYTSKGSSSTGNATAYSAVTNDVNSNTTSMTINGGTGAVAVNSNGTNDSSSPCEPNTPCAQGDGTYAGNIGTTGTAVAVDVTAAAVTNENMGVVTNVVGTTANTGGNMTGGEEKKSCCDCDQTTTTTSTGDATAGTSVSNTVNTNDTTVVVMN